MWRFREEYYSFIFLNKFFNVNLIGIVKIYEFYIKLGINLVVKISVICVYNFRFYYSCEEDV